MMEGLFKLTELETASAQLNVPDQGKIPKVRLSRLSFARLARQRRDVFAAPLEPRLSRSPSPRGAARRLSASLNHR